MIPQSQEAMVRAACPSVPRAVANFSQIRHVFEVLVATIDAFDEPKRLGVVSKVFDIFSDIRDAGIFRQVFHATGIQRDIEAACQKGDFTQRYPPIVRCGERIPSEYL